MTVIPVGVKTSPPRDPPSIGQKVVGARLVSCLGDDEHVALYGHRCCFLDFQIGFFFPLICWHLLAFFRFFCCWLFMAVFFAGWLVGWLVGWFLPFFGGRDFFFLHRRLFGVRFVGSELVPGWDSSSHGKRLPPIGFGKEHHGTGKVGGGGNFFSIQKKKAAKNIQHRTFFNDFFEGHGSFFFFWGWFGGSNKICGRKIPVAKKKSNHLSNERKLWLLRVYRGEKKTTQIL